MADGIHAPVHSLQAPGANPSLHRIPAYAKRRKLCSRHDTVLLAGEPTQPRIAG